MTTFNGTLPSEIGMLSNLRELTFEDNLGIHGKVPTEFARLANIGKFWRRASANPIVSNLISPSFLLNLAFATITLIFLLPALLRNDPDPVEFFLHGNSLHGSIDHLCSIDNGDVLYYSCELSCSCCKRTCENCSVKSCTKKSILGPNMPKRVNSTKYGPIPLTP